MKIFIMRHGEAEPYNTNDKGRQLSKFGMTQAEHAGQWLSSQLKTLSAGNANLDIAFVSPYVRAQQTFECFKSSLSIADIQSSDMVTPLGDADDVQDYIDAYCELQPSIQSILIVSHMPLVSLLSDKMCLGFNARIFDTADILMFEYDPIESKGQQISFYQSLT